MENSMNKAITIAVGIFITVAITSGILFSINEMRNIYSQVYETDTSITSRFSEYDAFDGTVVTGVDVINAVKKYKGRTDINFEFNGVSKNDVDNIVNNAVNETKKMEFYVFKFDSNIDTTNEENIKITFTKNNKK